MNPDEEIRIKIAEACGWRPYKPITHDGWPLLMTPPKKPNKEGWLEPIPDYLNSLDAMHEAEKELVSNWRWNTYTSNLAQVCGWRRQIHDDRTMANVICAATARQRAEAFIKTVSP